MPAALHMTVLCLAADRLQTAMKDGCDTRTHMHETNRMRQMKLTCEAAADCGGGGAIGNASGTLRPPSPPSPPPGKPLKPCRPPIIGIPMALTGSPVGLKG